MRGKGYTSLTVLLLTITPVPLGIRMTFSENISFNKRTLCGFGKCSNDHVGRGRGQIKKQY